MALRVEDAVATLTRSADAQAVDPTLQHRLAAVQALLASDLRWVEAALDQAASEGPAPATDAARHLVSRGGKRVRPMALLLSAACFGPIPAAARELAVVCELVHSATLLHDDVIDDGDERRGAPTARRIWGNGISVLSGDLLLVHSLSRTLAHAPALMPDLIETLTRLVEGEILQMRGRTELDVSLETYERVLRGKTASLFGWATRAGAQVSGAGAEAARRLFEFGEALGMAFQLVDDVIDYSGERSGKPLFADLSEGKLTLPLVLAVEERPELLGPLARIHAGDLEPVAEVAAAVLESGACDEVRRRAGEHTARAIAALEAVPGGSARELLAGVARGLAERAS
ncbi:MAG: polyprenyl synthetase family protein [Polyangiaceae bacterium]|nr:polyprenyl synthetase family protein [Polyangiaceae bacterium]